MFAHASHCRMDAAQCTVFFAQNFAQIDAVRCGAIFSVTVCLTV